MKNEIKREENNISKYKEMRNYQKRLEKQIDFLSEEINHYPSGNIFCHNKGKSIQWFRYHNNTREYIPQKEEKLKIELIKRKYMQLQREDCLNEKKAIEAYLSHMSKKKTSLSLELLKSEEYRPYLQEYCKCDEIDIQNWINSSYEKSKDHPEHLLHKSISGNILRSKSEAMIDMMLYSKNIPYRYEQVLNLAENVIVPDFTILHPVTKKIIYWEHFGLIDKQDYFNKYQKKVEIYTKNQIYPCQNLIMTFETSDHPLTLEQIEQTIEKFFMSEKNSEG